MIKSLEDSGLLLIGVTKTVEKELREQIGGFLSVLLGTLGASLLEVLRAGEGVLRAGYGCSLSSASQNNNKMDF